MDFGYAGDSFHTLGRAEQAGLVALSLALAAGMAALAWRLAGPIRAVVLFWLFVWLSPQVFYLYYQMIFDGLPWQIVVRGVPGPGRILRLLTFTVSGTLSDHGAGLLGWGLVGLALWRKKRTHDTVQGPVA